MRLLAQSSTKPNEHREPVVDDTGSARSVELYTYDARTEFSSVTVFARLED